MQHEQHRIRGQVPMRAKKLEFRCECCGVLLGVIEGDRFVVKRGDMQTWTWGEGYISMMCYNPRCRYIDTLKIPKMGGPSVVAR